MSKCKRRTSPNHTVTTAMYKKGTTLQIVWLMTGIGSLGRTWITSSPPILTQLSQAQVEVLREGSSFRRDDNPRSVCRDLDHYYWDGSIYPHETDLVLNAGGTLVASGDHWKRIYLPSYGNVMFFEEGTFKIDNATIDLTFLEDGFRGSRSVQGYKPLHLESHAFTGSTPYLGAPIAGLTKVAKPVGYCKEYSTYNPDLPLEKWGCSQRQMYGCSITLAADTRDLSTIFSQIAGINHLAPLTLPMSSNDIGDKLSGKVYEQMLANPVNNLENLASAGEILHFVSLIKKLKHGDPELFSLLLKKGKSWKKIITNLQKHGTRQRFLKELAGANLAYQYSVKTTLMDIDDSIKAVKRGMDKQRTRLCSYHKTNASTTSTDVAYSNGFTCTTDWKSHMIVCHMAPHNGFLQSLGLNPSYSNLWDVVPFSFVVNWFIDFDHMFSVVDRQDYFNSNVKIAYSVLTHKTIRTFTGPTFQGSIKQVFYNRRAVPGPPIFVGSGREGITLNRLVNGVSLVISGGKKPRG